MKIFHIDLNLLLFYYILYVCCDCYKFKVIIVFVCYGNIVCCKRLRQYSYIVIHIGVILVYSFIFMVAGALTVCLGVVGRCGEGLATRLITS